MCKLSTSRQCLLMASRPLISHNVARCNAVLSHLPPYLVISYHADMMEHFDILSPMEAVNATLDTCTWKRLRERERES